MAQRVLVVDDEPKILVVLASFLESKGFEVIQAQTGARALELLAREKVSLVLLDLMLPDIPGEEVCRRMREKLSLPIIMLTAKAEEEDVLKGLGVGADDYVTKPFSLKELFARIDSLLRRTSDLAPLQSECFFGTLHIDFGKGEVCKNGKEVGLTPSEMGLLSAMAKRPGKAFTRQELIDAVFGDEFDGFDRAIDNHIKNLRQKIEDDPRKPTYIKTVHGLGYKFEGSLGLQN
ncbi:MAG: response regulator transcription factor [Clostridiales bacterium]|jgi:DNA-binding response OmpR family regulator|nr:response regulator transcription factor [Clostridiales bacterium]